jgi:hypothetical protein
VILTELLQSEAPSGKRWLGWALNLLAAGAGAWFCWGFGAQLNSTLLAVVTAANGAVISALLAHALFERFNRG